MHENVSYNTPHIAMARRTGAECITLSPQSATFNVNVNSGENECETSSDNLYEDIA